MAHIYINEVIGDDRQPYLILHGNDAEVTARKIMGMIENSFNSSWEHNPKLRGKVEKTDRAGCYTGTRPCVADTMSERTDTYPTCTSD